MTWQPDIPNDDDLATMGEGETRLLLNAMVEYGVEGMRNMLPILKEIVDKIKDDDPTVMVFDEAEFFLVKAAISGWVALLEDDSVTILVDGKAV